MADKIEELLNDSEKRRRMGAYGRQRVKDVLHWEHEKPKLLAAYDTIFSRCQQRRHPIWLPWAKLKDRLA
jgi:glycosyltransferase involved in cell wall biosynthesis